MNEVLFFVAAASPLLVAALILICVAFSISRQQRRFALADGDVPETPPNTRVMTVVVWWMKPQIGKPIYLIFGQEKVGVGWPTIEFEAADEIAEKIRVNHVYRMRVAETPAKRTIIDVIEDIGEML